MRGSLAADPTSAPASEKSGWIVLPLQPLSNPLAPKGIYSTRHSQSNVIPGTVPETLSPAAV